MTFTDWAKESPVLLRKPSVTLEFWYDLIGFAPHLTAIAAPSRGNDRFPYPIFPRFSPGICRFAPRFI
jgi:hypothetical protein